MPITFPTDVWFQVTAAQNSDSSYCVVDVWKSPDGLVEKLRVTNMGPDERTVTVSVEGREDVAYPCGPGETIVSFLDEGTAFAQAGSGFALSS